MGAPLIQWWRVLDCKPPCLAIELLCVLYMSSTCVKQEVQDSLHYNVFITVPGNPLKIETVTNIAIWVLNGFVSMILCDINDITESDNIIQNGKYLSHNIATLRILIAWYYNDPARNALCRAGFAYIEMHQNSLCLSIYFIKTSCFKTRYLEKHHGANNVLIEAPREAYWRCDSLCRLMLGE